MKPVKNLLCAAVLVSAMAVNTLAGVQDTPGYTGPPTPPTPERQMTTSDNTSDTTNEAGGITLETADYLFFEVLTALLSVY